MGVYQEEAKIIYLQRDKYFLWFRTKHQKNLQTVVHVSPLKLGIVLKIIPLRFLKGDGCSGKNFLTLQTFMDKHAPQNGGFFIFFVIFTSTLVGWLILLQPVAGWDIMGCEYEPLPNYIKLRNCS